MTLLDCKAEVNAVDDKGWSAPEAGESGAGFPTHLRKAVSSTITIPMKQPEKLATAVRTAARRSSRGYY